MGVNYRLQNDKYVQCQGLTPLIPRLFHITYGTQLNFTYDNNGNMTYGWDFTNPSSPKSRNITYNADNMPDSITYNGSITTNFLYDGMGTRVKKSVGSTHTYYIGDHFEVKGGTITRYIFAGNLRIAQVEGSTRSYFHKDHLGSSTVMTDNSGVEIESTEYMPFGSQRNHAGFPISAYRFTDQELDAENGLYNYNARLYDPFIGRFISPDTIVPQPFNPQSLNRYSYCLNNPLIYTDPSGHAEEDEEELEEIEITGSRLYYFNSGMGWDAWVTREQFLWLWNNVVYANQPMPTEEQFFLQMQAEWGSQMEGGYYSSSNAPAAELNWMKIAKGEVGTKEIVGSKHSEKVLEYHSTTGKFKDDEKPWCSSFVNWVMEKSGIEGTGSAWAKSWKNWGTMLDKPAYGSIAIFDYGEKGGHVGFVAGKTSNGSLVILGGNQTNSVKYSSYSTGKIIGYVVPKGHTPNYILETLTVNNNGGGYASTR